MGKWENIFLVPPLIWSCDVFYAVSKGSVNRQWRPWSNCIDPVKVLFSIKNCWYLSYFFMKTCFRYPIEASCQDTSNEYPQHIFSWRDKKNIYLATILIWCIRLHKCAGWPGPLLSTSAIRALFSCCGSNITKPCLYNFDPFKAHFYIVKLGFTGVYIIFLISAQKHRFEYSLEPPLWGGSNKYPQSMFWAEIWKISEFLSENFQVLVVKFSIYLNRRVFVMH